MTRLSIRLRVAGPAIAALVLSACDAGRRVCLDARIVGADDCAPAAGDTLRVFWFDDADDDLFDGPVEETVKRVGDERRRSVSRGITQRDWATAEIAAGGGARCSLLTFYAGGFPVWDLAFTKREEDPTGVWIEVVPASGGRSRQAFVVRDVDGTPTLVRLRLEEGLWKPVRSAGSIEVLGWDADVRCYRWDASIPLEPWTRP